MLLCSSTLSSALCSRQAHLWHLVGSSVYYSDLCPASVCCATRTRPRICQRTYADWPNWVYWNGSTWEDLDSSLDTGNPYDGQVDMSAVTTAKAIVRNAVGTVSEGTTKSA